MTERYNEALRSARLARGTELKEVARVTRISQRVLEAIESGNTQILPAAYVRAFLRDYAVYLGLDPQDILAAYDVETPRKDQAPEYTPPSTQKPQDSGLSTVDDPESVAPQRIQPMKPPRVKRVDTNLTAVIAIGIVVLTGFVLVYFFLAGDANDKKTHTVTSPAPPPPIVPQYTPEVPVAKTVQDSAKSQTTQTYATDSLTLEATTVDSVWMSVMADTAHVQRGVMTKGSHHQWRAKTKFLITLGNSRLAKLTLNGKVLRANDSISSRVLRNVIITAGTTELSPVEISAVPAAIVSKHLPAKIIPPAKPPAVNSGHALGTPSKTPNPAVKAPGVTTPTPTPSRPAVRAPLKPAPQRVAKKKIRLKPFPDTIKKIQIK